MKKSYVLIFLIPLILFGCNNMSDESQLSVSARLHYLNNDSANNRALPSDDVTEMKLWISDSSIDYWLIEDPVEGADIASPVEGESSGVIDRSTVRLVTTNNSEMEVFVYNNLEWVFTIRTVFESGRVFVGTTNRLITDYTENVTIDVYETSTSQNIETFKELDEYIKEW